MQCRGEGKTHRMATCLGECQTAVLPQGLLGLLFCNGQSRSKELSHVRLSPERLVGRFRCLRDILRADMLLVGVSRYLSP